MIILMKILTILFLLSKTMFLLSLYQQKIIKNYQNTLVRYLKNQFIGMNIKQRVIIKIRQINIDNFSNQILLFILVYSNQDDNAKRFKTQTYYVPKGTIKNYNIINGKKLLWSRTWFWYKVIWKNQKINNSIKLYEEIRKLTTRQDEDYWMFIRLWLHEKITIN